MRSKLRKRRAGTHGTARGGVRRDNELIWNSQRSVGTQHSTYGQVTGQNRLFSDALETGLRLYGTLQMPGLLLCRSTGAGRNEWQKPIIANSSFNSCMLYEQFKLLLPCSHSDACMTDSRMGMDCTGIPLCEHYGMSKGKSMLAY